MKLSNAALSLAAVGAGLVVAGLLIRTRAGSVIAPLEPPPPKQLIGTPRAHLSAIEAAESFRADPTPPH